MDAPGQIPAVRRRGRPKKAAFINEDPAVTDLLRIIEATAIENGESDDENNEEENDENMDF